jgi:hypothetical protein
MNVQGGKLAQSTDSVLTLTVEVEASRLTLSRDCLLPDPSILLLLDKSHVRVSKKSCK